MRCLAASRFLVGRWEKGPWLRISGASGFEWSVLDGCEKERQTLATLKRLLAPGMVVFDVGANVGYFSLVAGLKVGPTGAVHAFEPTPGLSARIRENAALNGIANITVNSVAISDHDGAAFLSLQEDSEGNSLVRNGTSRAVSVPCLTLDSYMVVTGLARVDVMKIDCEGSEARVIRGASRLLDGPFAPVLLIEFNAAMLNAQGSSLSELATDLEHHGYSCRALERLTSTNPPVYNVIGIKAEHRKRFPMLTRLDLDADVRVLGIA
jgi:FkbM family methyltransferase